MLAPSYQYGYKCPSITSKSSITTHNTYNDASARAEVSYMIGNRNYVSYHAAVDDIEVVQGIDFNRNTYHCGNSTGNSSSISIEICYSKSGGARFDKAERNAAEYTAFLLRQRGWGVERVYTHQYWNGKYCPHRTLDLGWSRYKSMVSLYLNPPVQKKDLIGFCVIDDPTAKRIGVAYNEEKYKGKVVFDFHYRVTSSNAWKAAANNTPSNWITFTETVGDYQLVCRMKDKATGKAIAEISYRFNTASGTKVTATNASWKNNNEILLGFTVNNKNIKGLKYRALLFDKTTGKWFDRRNSQWSNFTPNKSHKYVIMFQAYLDDKKHKDGRVIAQKQINVL